MAKTFWDKNIYKQGWPAVIHCSDTPNGKTIGDTQRDSVDVIRDWHISRGFRDIGYHFVIDPDGTIHKGRSLDQAGAHCKGFNSSWGICLIGRDKFTKRQFKSLRYVLESLEQFGLNTWNIWCHYEKNHTGKTCPNMRCSNIVLWYRALEDDAIKEYLIKDKLLDKFK